MSKMYLPSTTLLTVRQWNNGTSTTFVGPYFKSISASTFKHFLLPSTNQQHGPSMDLWFVNGLRSSILSVFFMSDTGTTLCYHRRLAMTVRQWINGPSLLPQTHNLLDVHDLISVAWTFDLRSSPTDHHRVDRPSMTPQVISSADFSTVFSVFVLDSFPANTE